MRTTTATLSNEKQSCDFTQEANSAKCSQFAILFQGDEMHGPNFLE